MKIMKMVKIMKIMKIMETKKYFRKEFYEIILLKSIQNVHRKSPLKKTMEKVH